ncbi:TAM domain methyltransferase [Thelonectria olida]|uniref:TAM domain methyltransferase n=1 Tax=Thelonectria olida TaxID=1576542 RepID=A0A9P8W4H7_9HYPO|nr:TAM domain methyltransferase [Thelonectria olida]
METETDSTFGEENSTSGSLTNSITNYQNKHGRTYHALDSGIYPFPNDIQERDRLDMVHAVFNRALEGHLHRAPIDDNPPNVLDIGTGTGIWAIEFADSHGGSRVRGIDLSPIQPTYGPRNLEFLVDNVEKTWSDSIKYDFIHSRCMAGAIEDWQRLVNQAFDNLREGGWVEFQELVGCAYSKDSENPQPNHAMFELMESLSKAGEINHRTMDPGPSFTDWAGTSGFINIEEYRTKLPFGIRPDKPDCEDIGSLLAASFYYGVDGLTAVPLIDTLEWPAEKVCALNDRVRRACNSPDTRLQIELELIVVFAQKP